MSDRYLQLVASRPGGVLAGRLGLPRPVVLERHRPGDPVIHGRVLVGGAPAARLLDPVARVLTDVHAELATGAGEPAGAQRLKALVFDATGITDCSGLESLHAFFHPTVGRLDRCGRVIVLGSPPEGCAASAEATAQRALEGFTRSLGKEIGAGGSTVQLLLVAAGAEEEIASTLRFLLSPRSAYVSGQVIHVQGAAMPAGLDWERPLEGKVALVTGAARGIGQATARTLAREGAHVVGLDVPGLAHELAGVTDALGGESMGLDIAAPEAPEAIAKHFEQGLDVLVHNAGVTRDRTLAKMPAERWRELVEINLCSQERIDEALLSAGALRKGGRIVCVSSMSAIAGNAGQSNYATAKAGVIGRVQALAPTLAESGSTINAVAPGFIETGMTARMPLGIREAGRRMSSLCQGGQPVDVAETIAWLAHPASGGLNGSVVRVCGQNFLGA